MQRIIPILIFLIIIILGFVIKSQKIMSFTKRKKKLVEYANTFIEFANDLLTNHHWDNEKYTICIRSAENIQAELGIHGILSVFHDPLNGVVMRDYPLLINVFLEFRAVMNSLDNGFTIQNLSLLVGSCSDAFLKHDAWLQEMIDCNRRNMLNPVSCFGEGIRYIVGLPFDILYWLGIINKNKNVQIHNNLILRLLGSVVSLISFLGSVISIVVGWKSFIIICSSLKNFIK